MSANLQLLRYFSIKKATQNEWLLYKKR